MPSGVPSASCGMRRRGEGGLPPGPFLFQLVKLCVAMIDTGKAFCVANRQFMNGIRDLAQYSSQDALVEVSLWPVPSTSPSGSVSSQVGLQFPWSGPCEQVCTGAGRQAGGRAAAFVPGPWGGPSPSSLFLALRSQEPFLSLGSDASKGIRRPAGVSFLSSSAHSGAWRMKLTGAFFVFLLKCRRQAGRLLGVEGSSPFCKWPGLSPGQSVDEPVLLGIFK